MTLDCFPNYKYSGFCGANSACEIRVFKESNLIFASHLDFKGTSPTNMAEKLAQRTSKEFGLRLKRIRMVIYIPSSCAIPHRDQYSILKFSITRKLFNLRIDDVEEFIPIELPQIHEIISGRKKYRLDHKIRFSIC